MKVLTVLSLAVALFEFLPLTAMEDTAIEAIAGVLQKSLTSVRTVTPKNETGLDLLSQELQALIEKHVTMEKERQKQAEKESRRSVVEVPVDFSFQQYSISIDQIAGGVSREVRNIMELLKNPARFRERGLKELPLGLLLHGPSGTGKTLLAKLIASQTGRLMAHEYSSSFITSFQGSGVERIKRLFDEARKLNTPVILFIDEIDGLANNELKGSEGEATRAVHELHKQMGIAHPHIFVIMATNNYDKIPASIIDRFANNTLFIGLPDFSARFALLKQLCTSARIQLSDQFFYKLATETDGLSCRVLENVFTNALISAGLRVPDSSVSGADFYLAAYTTQKMKLPNAMRRLKLIKHYLSGKNLAANIDDECINICVHETEEWDAQKIEKWVTLAQGLATATGSAEIDRQHMLIAFSLVAKDKIPHKMRRKLLFTHFLTNRRVKNLPRFLDLLLEETEDVSTEGLQKMIELAVDIMKRKKQPELTKKHLFTACTLTFKRPLNHYKRVLLLKHYLEDTQGPGISKEFINALAAQIQHASIDEVKNIVGTARDISRVRGSLAPVPDDFYVAVCLSQKNEPIRLKEYRVALVKYYLKNRIEQALSQEFFEELIDNLKGQTPVLIEAVIKGSENWARKRSAPVINKTDISLALYEICFKDVREQSSLRETIINFLLEGKGRASGLSKKKLIHGTRGLVLDRIIKVFDYALEASDRSIGDADLYVGLFLELKNDEKDVYVDRGGYTIEDKFPQGDQSKVPDESQRMALLKFYLKRRYHLISDAFKTFFVESTQGATRHGIERIVESAAVHASLHGIKHNGEVHIREFNMINATGEVYPHVGFWPWRIQSFGGVRDAFHRGFNVKEG